MRALNLDKSNRVHQTAWIEEGAVLGRDNYVGPYCYIGSNVTIGDGNTFSGYVSIGMEAEHRDYFRKEGEIIIGSQNVVREFSTINSSTKWVTRMGNHCVMLRGSHLSHDSVLEDNVNLSCNVLIGGESYVMEGAVLGLGSIVHQRQIIGAFAMLGMGTIVTRQSEILPGVIYIGNPAKSLKKNTVGLSRNFINAERLAIEENRWRSLKNKGWL